MLKKTNLLIYVLILLILTSLYLANRVKTVNLSGEASGQKSNSISRFFNRFRNTPRIMMWPGKVNQHWDLKNKVWLTDPDGVSGASYDEVAYCKKFYPNTISVEEYKMETIDTWRDRDNEGVYTSTRMSYRCVQE